MSKILTYDEFLNESNNIEALLEGDVNYQSDQFALVMIGGSIGSKGSAPIFIGRDMGNIIETSNDKDSLVEKAKRMRKALSPGERKYYGLNYKVVELTAYKRKEVDYLISKQNTAEDTSIAEGEIFVTDNSINEGSQEDVINEAVATPEELASFIQKEEKHFAAFLKPKKLTATVNGKVVTIKPGSGSFTITVDYAKSTIDTTGKPEWPESTSYVELMEYIKITKFKVLD